MLSEKGGFVFIPTTGADYVLSESEIGQVRKLADEVHAKFPAEKDAQGNVLPWDIEFGFAKGELWLFQIRPLSRYRETKTLEALASMEGPGTASRKVNLNAEVEQP
jgi:hypothetical protein